MLRLPLFIFFILLQSFRFIADKLGPERISKVKIVGNEEVEQSSYGQIILGIGKGLLSGVDEQLAKEAIKAGPNLELVYRHLIMTYISFGVEVSC